VFQSVIELRIAPALETLHQLINDGLTHHFDFIFIDADKTNYLKYYELSLQLVSPNGLIAIDNMFWDGKVIDPTETGAQVRDIRLLNKKIKNDQRIWGSLLPIADGLFLIKPQTA
jgi:predicted O-methyltransferase YrrM